MTASADAFASAAAAAASRASPSTNASAVELDSSPGNAAENAVASGGSGAEAHVGKEVSGGEEEQDGVERGSPGGEEREAKRQRRESVGSQLMSTLASELGLNAPQVDSLIKQKDAIRADREIVSDCMRQIHLLRMRVTEHIISSQCVTDELRRILEPTQVARFLLWVERNQRSMNLLNSIVAFDGTASV
jgi:hypothetical protein